jgi:hypothetical protein
MEMALYIVGAVSAILLIGYIIFLRIRLAKRNIFIESTVRRLSGIEKSRSMDQMIEFLSEINNLSQYRSFFADKFLENSTLNFILENDAETEIFLHYTKDESVAEDILRDGFRFAHSFYKTTEKVSNDKLDLINKHNIRKFFGDYIVVINIAKEIVTHYSSELEKADLRSCSFENVLSVKLPLENEDSDPVYQLAVQYIKGYVNYRTGGIVINPLCNPWHDSPRFVNNIKFLVNKRGKS